MENWKKIIRETLDTEAGGPRKLYNSPGEAINRLDSIVPPNPNDPNNPAARGGKALITVGYVTDASVRIDMPNKVKRRYEPTNRMRTYNDYSELGEGIGGLVCITSYNYNYQHSSFVNSDYGTRYKPQYASLRAKYGVPLAPPPPPDPNKPKKPVDPNLIAQNMASQLHKTRYYYPVDMNGRVLRNEAGKPLCFNERSIKQYIKQGDPRDAIDGVKALKKIEAKNEVIDQYVSEYKGLNMTYKLFKASSILYISGFDKVKGEKFAYANPQIMNAVSDIDINQQDFYEIAHDRYEADFRKYDELQAQSAAQQEPAMALSTESRRRQLRLTESELKQVVKEAAMKIVKQIYENKAKRGTIK